LSKTGIIMKINTAQYPYNGWNKYCEMVISINIQIFSYIYFTDWSRKHYNSCHLSPVYWETELPGCSENYLEEFHWNSLPKSHRT